MKTVPIQKKILGLLSIKDFQSRPKGKAIKFKIEFSETLLKNKSVKNPKLSICGSVNSWMFILSNRPL